MNEGPTWLGNIPVVFGEFGTYFNLRTSDEEPDPKRSEDMGAHLLNSYYEAFEELGLGNMLWCFSKSNSAKYGEDWNHEDFSIIDPQGQPRAWQAVQHGCWDGAVSVLEFARQRQQPSVWLFVCTCSYFEHTFNSSTHFRRGGAGQRLGVGRRGNLNPSP